MLGQNFTGAIKIKMSFKYYAINSYDYLQLMFRGEQYYLQIDSHSEFVQDWDEKLIKMVEDAPAKKPVISTYPPDR